ncbi:MAG TPA: VOC family protein [Caulobacteraceae bacterium]|nr:VOC family protein [Caulobacteraceae bacterium]
MDLGYFEISLDVADIARSLEFYEKLGFEKVEGGVDIRTVTLQKGGCRLGLYQGYLQPAETQLIFWQGDIPALAAEVELAGLSFFHGPNYNDTGAAFMLKDPDDHPIYVINQKVNYPDQPAYTRPAEPAPRTARGTGPGFGWFIVSLAVVDLERTVDFYRKLGFELTSRQERVATLRNKDCTISLYQGIIDPDRSQLAFWQGDVYAIASDLTAKGLVVERGPTTDAAGDGAILKDPDGHTIHIINVERLRRREPA